MVTGIGWSGEATRFVWNARAQKWRAGRRPKERRSTVTLEIPKNIKFLKASHRHKHLERGVQNRINESLHQQGYRLAITSIGHGANPGDLLYARAAGPYAGGACAARPPDRRDRPIRNWCTYHCHVRRRSEPASTVSSSNWPDGLARRAQTRRRAAQAGYSRRSRECMPMPMCMNMLCMCMNMLCMCMKHAVHVLCMNMRCMCAYHVRMHHFDS